MTKNAVDIATTRQLFHIRENLFETNMTLKNAWLIASFYRC